jgi:hypothetical protein
MVVVELRTRLEKQVEQSRTLVNTVEHNQSLVTNVDRATYTASACPPDNVRAALRVRVSHKRAVQSSPPVARSSLV